MVKDKKHSSVLVTEFLPGADFPQPFHFSIPIAIGMEGIIEFLELPIISTEEIVEVFSLLLR